MGYEQSPAVEMLATNCALCGRPLLDSESVECGMGPTCRARHGASDALRSPDWESLPPLAEGLPEPLAERVMGFVADRDARGLANWAVNRIAADPAKVWCDALILVVAAAGFVRLAGALADRHSRQVVNVEQLGAELLVRAPYNQGFVEQTRHWRGRRWDKEGRVLRLPAASRSALWDALRANFGQGTMVVGAHGMKRI